jgi:hypothetical protein
MTTSNFLKSLALTLTTTLVSCLGSSSNDCNIDKDCDIGSICKENACTTNNNNNNNNNILPNQTRKGNIESINENDLNTHNVRITTGFTNSQGAITFEERVNPTHPGELVEIQLINRDRSNIDYTLRVTYYDGDGMECFDVESLYGKIGGLHCFDHNSKHLIKLSSLLFDFVTSDSDKAISRFQVYSKNVGKYRGCLTREEMNDLVESNSFIFKKFSQIFGLNLNEDGFDNAVVYMKQEMDSNTRAHIFNYTPALASHGSWATSITSVEIDTVRGEDCSTPIDDNCNGEVNEGCTTPPNNPPPNNNPPNECVFQDETICFNNDLWYIDTCDNPLEIYRPCEHGCSDNNECDPRPNNNPPQERVRFVDNGDGTVTDNGNGYEATGQRRVRIWQKTPSQSNWQDAIEDCQRLNLRNSRNWQLPPSSELARLIDPQGNCLINPNLDERCGNYWSSTTQNSGGREQCRANEKIAVPFTNGNGRAHCEDDEEELYVRCMKSE